jgi:hypothetical protein
MSKENNELVATYHVDDSNYYLYACYDNWEDRNNRKVSFYDLYDKRGYCVNEGDPYYSFPSWYEIYDSMTKVKNDANINITE